MNRELEKLLESARQRQMTPEEIEAQRVSFAYGNAADGDKSTIETVKAASAILKRSTAEK